MAYHGSQKKDLTSVKAHIRSRMLSGMEQWNPLDGETLILESESDVVERESNGCEYRLHHRVTERCKSQKWMDG